MFTTTFSYPHAYPGDTLECEVDGFRIIARIEHDPLSDGPDKESDGFWPSLDKSSPGYIGPKSVSTLQRQKRHAEMVMHSWCNDEWFYCGVVLSVYRGDVCLCNNAASLWRIECNYPAYNKRLRNNDYLTEVANDLLPEALAIARDTMTELVSVR